MEYGNDITKYLVSVNNIPVCLTSSDDESDDCGSVSKAILYAVITITVILILYQLTSTNIQCSLVSSGWIVFYLDGCGACSQQSSILPGFSNYGLYRRGVDNLSYISGLQIPYVPKAFPFWYNSFTNNERYGYQDLSHLRFMAKNQQ